MTSVCESAKKLEPKDWDKLPRHLQPGEIPEKRSDKRFTRTNGQSGELLKKKIGTPQIPASPFPFPVPHPCRSLISADTANCSRISGTPLQTLF